MQVTVAVPGRFHFHNYVKYLHEAGVLDQCIYSHKRQTSMGLPPEYQVNVYLKEYLIQAHSKLFGSRLADFCFPKYHEIWRYIAQRHLRTPDILHVMLHGTFSNFNRRRLPSGCVVLGEAVNTHPTSRNRKLQEEEKSIFGKPRFVQSTLERRQLKELQLADYVLAPSGFVKQSYVDHGYPAEKIFVVPYAGNPDKFPAKQSYSERKEKVRVIVVATVCPRKAQHRLLEAIRHCSSTFDITFVGSIDTSYAEYLKKTYSDLPFTIPGAVNQTELASLLHNADIYCLPSIEEGLAVSICEAMSAGLPVVASDESGAGEIVQSGTSGFTYPAMETQRLSTLLDRLANDPDERRTIGQNAASIVRTTSNWQTYAHKLIDVYKSIAQ